MQSCGDQRLLDVFLDYSALYMCVCVYVYIYMYVCVCAQKKKKKKTQPNKQTKNQKPSPSAKAHGTLWQKEYDHWKIKNIMEFVGGLCLLVMSQAPVIESHQTWQPMYELRPIDMLT